MVVPTNFNFGKEKLNLRSQDVVKSIRHRGPRSFATQQLCNVINLCGEFQEAARSLKLSLDKPSDLQKRRQKSQLFATFLGRAVFNEFSYLTPALLTCV